MLRNDVHRLSVSRILHDIITLALRSASSIQSRSHRRSQPRHIILGRRGERLVETFIRDELGMRIIDRNVRTRSGEIDLIAEETDQSVSRARASRSPVSGTIVFIEVKTRTSEAKVAGEFAITRAKRQRLVRLVQSISRKRGWAGTRPLRIDVIILIWDGKDETKPILRHHPSAITLNDAR